MFKKYTVLAICLSLLSGCSSISKYSDKNKGLREYHSPIFFATRLDLKAIKKASGSSGGIVEGIAALLSPFYIMDLPISIIFDTITLPYDLYSNIGLKKRKQLEWDEKYHPKNIKRNIKRTLEKMRTGERIQNLEGISLIGWVRDNENVLEQEDIVVFIDYIFMDYSDNGWIIKHAINNQKFSESDYIYLLEKFKDKDWKITKYTGGITIKEIASSVRTPEKILLMLSAGKYSSWDVPSATGEYNKWINDAAAKSLAEIKDKTN